MVFLQPSSLQRFLRSRQSGARRIPPLPRQRELEAFGLGSGRVPEKNRGGSLGGVGEEDIISGWKWKPAKGQQYSVDFSRVWLDFESV